MKHRGPFNVFVSDGHLFAYDEKVDGYPLGVKLGSRAWQWVAHCRGCGVAVREMEILPAGPCPGTR